MFVQNALTRVNSFRFNDIPAYPPNILHPDDKSVFLDPTDVTSMFQNVDGTGAVSNGDPVGFMVDKSIMKGGQTVADYMSVNGLSNPMEIPGNHVKASANDATRPIYTESGAEKYLQFAATQSLFNETFGPNIANPNNPLSGVFWRWCVTAAVGIDSKAGGDNHFVTLSDKTGSFLPTIKVVGDPTNDYTLSWHHDDGALTPFVPGLLTTPAVVTFNHYSDHGVRGYQNGALDAGFDPYYDRDDFRDGIAIGRSGITTSQDTGFNGKLYSLWAIRGIMTPLEQAAVELWMDGLPGLGNGLADVDWHPSVLFNDVDVTGGVWEPWLYSFQVFDVQPWAIPCGVGDSVGVIVDQSGRGNNLVAETGKMGILDYNPPFNARDLAVNGDFSDDTLAPAWVPGAGVSVTAVVNNQRIDITNAGGSLGSYVQAVTVTPDRKYQLIVVGTGGTGTLQASLSTSPTVVGALADVQVYGSETWLDIEDYVATQRTIYIHLHCDGGGATASYDEVFLIDQETERPNFCINFEGNQFYESEQTVNLSGQYYIDVCGAGDNADGETSELFSYSGFNETSELSLGIYNDSTISVKQFDNRVRYRSDTRDTQLDGFQMSGSVHIIGAQRNAEFDVRHRVDGAERVRLTTSTPPPATNPRPLSIGRHNNAEYMKGRWFGSIVVNRLLMDHEARSCDNWLGDRSSVPVIDEAYQPHLLFDNDQDGVPDVEGGLWDLYDATSILTNTYAQAVAGQDVEVVLDKRHMEGQTAQDWITANVPGGYPISDPADVPGNHLIATGAGARPVKRTTQTPNEAYLEFDGSDELETGAISFTSTHAVISTGSGNVDNDTNIFWHADTDFGVSNAYALASVQGDGGLISGNVGSNPPQYGLDYQYVGITARQELYTLTRARNSAIMGYDLDLTAWSGFGVSNDGEAGVGLDVLLLEDDTAVNDNVDALEIETASQTGGAPHRLALE